MESVSSIRPAICGPSRAPANSKMTVSGTSPRGMMRAMMGAHAAIRHAVKSEMKSVGMLLPSEGCEASGGYFARYSCRSSQVRAASAYPCAYRSSSLSWSCSMLRTSTGR